MSPSAESREPGRGQRVVKGLDSVQKQTGRTEMQPVPDGLTACQFTSLIDFTLIDFTPSFSVTVPDAMTLFATKSRSFALVFAV